jgi:hypothetical protein
MSELLDLAIDAHGGIDRWDSFSAVAFDLVTAGQLWDIKGIGQDGTRRHVLAALHTEELSLAPFGQPTWRMVFTPSRVAIEADDGSVMAERLDPRASFAGHDMTAPWDPLHRAYWNGYTLWTYVTIPFLLTMPGFEVSEIAPWREGDEVWRGLRATFPSEVASHSSQQDFYFGPDMLLRRHDYHVDIAGGFPAAHYVSDFVEADGLLVPTRRRAYLRDERLRPIRDRLMIAIDFSDVRFHRSDGEARHGTHLES